ncbi:MAG: glycerophosphodiester phosphodiesterase [Clostridia bacterium]|nr:glycerophosphodiester phosphodiesterase [Clostridia bacterium]
MNKSLKLLLGVSAAASAGILACAGVLSCAVKNLPEGFTVTAHTGCENTEDNSLEAISAGVSAGADIVEFDLRFDAQGNGILAHDEGKTDSVTLDEALKLVSGYQGIKVNVDCKTTDNLKEVYAIGEKYGITDRLFYTGIEEDKVESVKNQTPEIAYFLNYAPKAMKKNDEQYIKELIALIKEKGAVGLNVRHTNCSKKMVEMLHAEGLMVSVWTANDVFTMARCISLLPDNITTRHPSVILKIINSLK